MGKRIQKIILLMISIIMIFSLTACKNKEVANESEEHIEEEVVQLSGEEQDEIMKEYYELLTERIPKIEITSFIDENIENLDKDKQELMIIALEEFLLSTDSTMEEDYTLLGEYKEYVSEEMKSYLNLLERETTNSFTDGEELKVDMNEVLDRALMAEQHIESFPGSKISNTILEIHREYIKASILGTGNPYIYAQEGSSIIKEEHLEQYKLFIENNKDTKTGNILKQYVDVLEQNNKDMNSEAINDFYDGLDSIIKRAF